MVDEADAWEDALLLASIHAAYHPDESIEIRDQTGSVLS